ncbi:MAG: amino acid ABC transporter permease [Bifidobacteriaceae bacterium]|jgi:polar amino acid transport system permease protein|nr:amino acid ABC transporter permease [Bifidobacteriaceae bacterium]
MTVAQLALRYAPWIAVSITALVLAVWPGVYRHGRTRGWVAAACVTLIAYPIGVLMAPVWLVVTVYWVPAGGAALSLALLATGLVGLVRRRRGQTRQQSPARPEGGDQAALSIGEQEGGQGGRPGQGPGARPPTTILSGRRRQRLRPGERAGLIRGLQYGVLIGAIVILVLATNWELMSERLFTLAGLRKAAPRIIPDFFNTVRYTLGAFAVSLTLGTVLALMKLSTARLYRALATAYIEFFRGMPALIVVFAVAYGIPMALGTTIPTISLKAAVALGCVSAAYMAESIRAGIQAVPKGQVEAARSLGMSHIKTLQSVVIPQAFRIVLPPVTNEIILLTKDTSLVYVMGLATREYELTKLARETLSVPEGGLTALFAIGACYLIITLPLGFLVRRMERGFGRGKS